MSREEMLAGIRRSLGRGALAEDARAALRSRLDAPHRNVRPARADIPRDEQIELFIALGKKLGVSTERLPRIGEVPQAIARRLEARSLERRVKLSPAPQLLELPWAEAAIEVRAGAAEESDRVGVSLALCGVAETGSVMFRSGSHTPIALCFLPPTHMIVLEQRYLLATFEDAWARLRSIDARRTMPRTALFVTGRSSTGDVGQKIVWGASGPLEVHVLLIEEASG